MQAPGCIWRMDTTTAWPELVFSRSSPQEERDGEREKISGDCVKIRRVHPQVDGSERGSVTRSSLGGQDALGQWGGSG